MFILSATAYRLAARWKPSGMGIKLDGSCDMSAKDLIQAYLRTMEARDLVSAQSMLTAHATIIFPGGKFFRNLHELAENARGRYQWVKKTFDHIDYCKHEDGAEIVYVTGTLYGVNNHNMQFEGIRYIDRFVVRDGKINEQYVWNDFAETGALALQSEIEAT
jgi:hypothetical protein